MKILWHSAAPWEPTGYGTQTAIWATWLAKQGHEVVLSARTGLMYAIGDHGGLPVLPTAPFLGEGVADEMLPGHVAAVQPDLVIILFDMWSFGLPPDRLPNVPIACWMPIDCSPVDQTDQKYLASGRIYPVAMSEFGKRELEALGYACGYVPHGIHTTKWNALPSVKAQIREGFGIPGDAFVIGINATSTDPERKGLWEQMEAFAIFRRKHPDAILAMHTLFGFAHGFNAATAAADLGIPADALRYPGGYDLMRGAITGDHMQNWYNALDVLSNVSMGEGFGLAAVEAQACGIPVILGDNSTGRQLVGPGWLVKGQNHWNARHGAKWQVPSIPGIVKAYEAAYTSAGHKRRQAWEFVQRFDVETVGPLWEPVLRAATGGQ
jgi:glycosyltransferase involved in cell wall biosynthesis